MPNQVFTINWYFKQLEIGESFRFLGKDEVCQKISKRKYKDSSGVTHVVPTIFYGIQHQNKKTAN